MRGLRVSKWSLINVYQSWYLQYIIRYIDIYRRILYIIIYIYIHVYILYSQIIHDYTVYSYTTTAAKHPPNTPTLLKNQFEGGDSYWNFILKFHFCNHAFSMINIPHYSMSLASRWKLNTCALLRRSQAHIRMKQHMCRDGITPKIALPSSYLPRLVKKCYFTIPFEGLDHHSRVSKQKQVEFDRLVLSPPRPL